VCVCVCGPGRRRGARMRRAATLCRVSTHAACTSCNHAKRCHAPTPPYTPLPTHPPTQTHTHAHTRTDRRPRWPPAAGRTRQTQTGSPTRPAGVGGARARRVCAGGAGRGPTGVAGVQVCACVCTCVCVCACVCCSTHAAGRVGGYCMVRQLAPPHACCVARCSACIHPPITHTHRP
jgi:hypothetical protein